MWTRPLRAGVALLVVALLAGAGAASGSRSAGTAHLFVRIALPSPGDIVVARIVVRGRPGIGVPVRLRLRALNAARISPSIAAVGGVVSLKRRPLKYVSAITIVNRLEKHPKPPKPYDRFIDVELVSAIGAKPTEARQYFAANKRVAWNVIAHFGQPRQQELIDLFQPVEADAETPLQKALADRGLDAVPLAGLPARTTSTRHDTPPAAVLLTDVSDVAKSACMQDSGHTEKSVKKVEGDLATTLSQITAAPTETKRCDLSRYSFKGLKLSFSAPGAGGSPSAYSLSSIAGSVCGDPRKTSWEVTYASTGEGNRTARPNFSTANPSTIRTRTFAGGSSIAAKLQYDTASTALMKVSGTPKGKVTKVVASPSQAAITSTAVELC